MERKKVPDRLRFYTKVAADGTGTVESDPIDQGEMLACQSIAFRNRTGARGAVILQVKQGAVTTVIAEEPAPAANEWYYYTYTQHLVAGEQIQASQASCSADDILDLHIVGYKTYGSQGEVV